jgi:hypothetical protein
MNHEQFVLPTLVRANLYLRAYRACPVASWPVADSYGLCMVFAPRATLPFDRGCAGGRQETLEGSGAM